MGVHIPEGPQTGEAEEGTIMSRPSFQKGACDGTAGRNDMERGSRRPAEEKPNGEG